MNVVSYLRVSGKGQVDGDGFGRQNQSIEDFCRHHKLPHVNQYQEAGVSGTVEGIDRPEFARMLGAIRDPNSDSFNAQAIVVERMDRLARDLMVSEMLLRECRENGIKVFSVDQGNLTDMASDGGDPTRVLIRQIMGALAQWEKSVLVKKLKASRERIRATGSQCEGKKAYGLKPGESFIMAQMRELRGDGKSYGNIAKILNEMGCDTRSGRPWKEQNVRTILVNHKPKKDS